MGDFFHGWRRKVGVAALGLACAVLGMWMRSRAVGDSLTIPVDRSVIGLSSQRERLTWQRLWYADGADLAAKQTLRNHSWNLLPPETDFRDIDYDWRTEYFGFTFYSGTLRPEALSSHLWSVPYWSLAIPLTLLSAYLILWKPRKRARDLSTQMLVSTEDSIGPISSLFATMGVLGLACGAT